MATVTPTTKRDIGAADDTQRLVSWALTTANNDGAPTENPTFSDRTFVATGTFGGATLTIEGSNDGANWVALKDVNGSAATLTANGFMHIQAAPLFMRPRLTVVGSGASIAVSGLIIRPTDARV